MNFIILLLIADCAVLADFVVAVAVVVNIRNPIHCVAGWLIL